MEIFRTSVREGLGKERVEIFVTLFGLQILMACGKSKGVNCLTLKVLAEKMANCILG